MSLDADDISTWRRDGFLRLPAPIDDETLTELRVFTDAIAAGDPRFDGNSPVLVHHEATERGTAITRAENLVPNHDGFRALATTSEVVDTVSALFDEPAVLYKEKVNFKQPGGAGFAPHQDATAYKFADDHVTVMLAIDDASIDNGCLEMVAGRHRALLATDGDGCLDPDVAETLVWQPVELEAGQMLAFTSRTPHRSASNSSDRPRRALFMTFNRRSAGDVRDAYYADKIRHLAAHDGGAAQRVSTIGHFLGKAPAT